jgi:drug/metabolite transporter (DMT)-like permease
MRRAFDARELFFGLAVIPGVALVVGGTPTGMRTGLAVGTVSAFLAAMFGILNKRFIEQSEALTVTGLEMAAGVACLSLIAVILPVSSVVVVPGEHDAALLAILALGCTLAPFALSLVALRRLTAFTSALALNMEPVYAIVLAIAIFGEQQELRKSFYAGVLIVLAVVFSHPLLLAAGSGNAEASPAAAHRDQ